MNGYIGRLLKVDLSKGTTESIPLDMEASRLYIGGRGLGIKYLHDLAPSNVDPLSPDNPLIFMTGPYTGTRGICSGLYNVTAKSPLTYTAGSGHSGGRFGPALKAAGFDGILILGRSLEPVYLLIDEGEATICSAHELWGQDVYSTTSYLEQKYTGVRVAAIGPAGENLVRFAAIMNDRHRAAARGGLGAVMGSKQLKAVAVRGTIPVEVARDELLRSLAVRGTRVARETGKAMTLFGTAGGIVPWNLAGGLSTRNHHEGYFEGAELIGAEEINSRFRVKGMGCFHCPIACSQVVQVHDEPYAVDALEGPEAETLVCLGSKCGIDDVAAVIKGNDICNRMGIDTISAGGTIAMAMEMYEGGLIGKELTGGIELKFGNGVAMVQLLKMIAMREGFGDVLAEGSRLAGVRLGAPHLSMSVNGMEIPACEPRATFGMGLSYVTSNRGACHLRSMIYVEEVFTGELDRFTVEGKAVPLKRKEDLMAVLDSFVMCKFGQRKAEYSVEDLTEILNSVTGLDYSPETLLEAGDRIFTLERYYSTRERSMELFLPDRFYDQALPRGAAQGKKFDKEEFARALQGYHEVRGWDERGVPTPEKLKELRIL